MSTRDRFSEENTLIYATFFALVLCSYAYASWEELYEAKKLLFMASYYATAAFLWDFLLRKRSGESFAFFIGLSIPVLFYAVFVFKLINLIQVDYNLRFAQKSLVIKDVEFEEMYERGFEYPVGFTLKLNLEDTFSFDSYNPSFNRLPIISSSKYKQIYYYHKVFDNFPIYERTQSGTDINYTINYRLNRYTTFLSSMRKGEPVCLPVNIYQDVKSENKFEVNWSVTSPISKQRFNLGSQLESLLANDPLAQSHLLKIEKMLSQFSEENMQAMGWSSTIGNCVSQNEKLAKAKYNKKICYCKE